MAYAQKALREIRSALMQFDEKLQITFEFEADPERFTGFEGVAVLHAFDNESEDDGTVLLYGSFGHPTTVAAVGMYRVAANEAEDQFREGDDIDD